MTVYDLFTVVDRETKVMVTEEGRPARNIYKGEFWKADGSLAKRTVKFMWYSDGRLWIEVDKEEREGGLNYDVRDSQLR